MDPDSLRSQLPRSDPDQYFSTKLRTVVVLVPMSPHRGWQVCSTSKPLAERLTSSNCLQAIYKSDPCFLTRPIMEHSQEHIPPYEPQLEARPHSLAARDPDRIFVRARRRR